MQVTWSPASLDDLGGIHAYIHEDNPTAADRVVDRIWNTGLSLATMPHRGTLDAATNARFLFVQKLPYILVYRTDTEADALEILRVYHTSRRRPPEIG